MRTIILLIILALTLSAPAQVSHSIKFHSSNLYFNSTSLEIGFREGNNEINVLGSIPVHSSGVGRLGITDFYKNTDLSANGVRAAFRHYHGNWYGEVAAKTFTLSFDAEINQGKIESYCYGTSAGLQIGYQYERRGFIVDFGIAGIELGQVSGRVKTVSKTSQDMFYMYNFVNDKVGNLPGYMTKKYSSSFSGYEVEGQLRSVPLILPRISIGIGYKF